MDDDDRDDRRGGFLRLERGRRNSHPNTVYIISDDQGRKDVGYLAMKSPAPCRWTVEVTSIVPGWAAA